MAAQAGPSVLPPAPLQSFRQLYDALEASSGTVPKRIVHDRLQQLLPTLQSACEPLQPPSAASRAKVQSGTIQRSDGHAIDLDAALRQCCLECSDLLQADEALVAATMRIFLDTEDVSQEQLLQTTDVLSSPGSGYIPRRAAHSTRKRKGSISEVTSSFVEAFCVFFLQERLYARRCVGALLRVSDDQYNDLHSIAMAVLDEFADKAYGAKCLSLATSLTNATLSDSIREKPRYSAFWAKHYLCEQLVLLEIVFLLYYSRLPSDADFVDAVVQLVKATNFGASQANAGFFDAEAARLVDCLAGMQVLLSVESLDVENVISGLDYYTAGDDRITSKPLLQAADIIEKAVAFLKTSTARDTLRAPLMLVWGLYLSRIEEACSDWHDARRSEPLPDHLQRITTALGSQGGAQSVWTDLTSVAMSPEMDIFGTMLGITQSPLLRGDSRGSTMLTMATSSSLAMRAVLKGFVLSITELVRPEFVHDFNGLIRLWEDTFDHEATSDSLLAGPADGGAALCAQFWEIDYEHEQRRSTLTTATRRFPVQFQPLLRLCRALSGSSSLGRSSTESDRAAAAAFEYLAEIAHITQAIPPSPSMAMPFEAVEADGDSTASYRATRDIAVFGKSLVVPRGTLGRMVSQNDEGPIVMTWALSDNPVSVWRLVRDVLAKFAGFSEPVENIVRHRRGSDAAVFADRALPATFSLLAAGEDPGQDGKAAATALNLISSMLNSSSRIQDALLRHLRGDDVQSGSLSQPHAASDHPVPSLVGIAMGILTQALYSPTIASDVISAGYRTLRHLTSSHINDLWLPLRSSGALVGDRTSASSSTSRLSHGSEGSSLLAFEISIGRFDGLIALLDFHAALLQDLQRSLLRCDAVELQIKVDVLLRALRFVCEAIWTEYQSWKYSRIRQRIEIGLRCLHILESILASKALRRFDGPQKQLVFALEQYLASETASPLAAYPLLEIIVYGKSFAENLSRNGRQTDIDLSRRLLERALTFATTLVSVRRDLNMSKIERGQQATLGHVEGAFFDQSFLLSRPHAAGGARETSTASVVMKYASELNAPAIRSGALVLLREVVGASATLGRSPAPALITHLGSLDDIASSLERLVEQATNEDEVTDIRCKTWDLLAVCVEAQPSLASLIITGKHVAAAPSQEGKISDALTASSASRTSALDAAVNLVKASHQSTARDLADLQVLDCALKFLSCAWHHALEHAKSFTSLRRDEAFWTALSELAFVAREPCETITDAVDITASGSQCDCEDAVRSSALRDMCSARSAQLFAEDIRLQAPSSAVDSGKACHKSLDQVIRMLSETDQLSKVLSSILTISFDAYRHEDIRERLVLAFPELSIENFAYDMRRDDFDERKTFGSSYVYDLAELHERLDGLVDATEGDEESRETLQGVVTQALLLVANVNLDWTLVDTQTCRLRGFASLLGAAFAPLSRRAKEDHAMAGKLRKSFGLAWVSGAELTANEGIDAPLARDVHMLRVSLLATLHEMLWTFRADNVRDEDKQATASEIKMAIRVVLHPLYSVEGIIRGAPSEQESTFCHDIFRLIISVTSRYERIKAAFDTKKEADAVALLALRREAESLATHSIAYAQILMAECVATLSSLGTSQDDSARRGTDLQLLLRSLAILLRDDGGIPVHVWSPKMQATSFLETAFELFTRAPIPSLTPIPDAGSVALSAPQAAIFSPALLDFFLCLASQKSSVEHLVLSGIVNAMSINALSSSLDTDMKPRLPTRIPSTSIDNALHLQWVRMLQVVVAILNTLGPAQSAIFCQNEMQTFFRIFQPLFEDSLSHQLTHANQLLLRTSVGRPFESRGATMETITVLQLEEAGYVFGLYTHVLRTMSIVGQDTTASQRSHQVKARELYAGQATLRLQEAVHLLQHPRELTMLLKGRHDAQEAQSSDTTNDLNAKRHLLRICASIVDSFWTLSDGLSVLCSTESIEWTALQLLILPSIGTSLSRPSTLGTIMDLVSYIVDALRAARGKESREETRALVALLEQVLSLATTQLALVSHVRIDASQPTLLGADTSSQFSNAEAGVGRDVGQSIELCKSALCELARPQGKEEKDTTKYVDVMITFHKRWNESTES